MLSDSTLANWPPYWPPILHRGREWKVGAGHFWHILTQDARAQEKVSCVGSQSCQGTPSDQVMLVLYHAARLVVVFFLSLHLSVLMAKV